MKKPFDRISIELMVQAAQMDKDRIWMQGDLEIQINGKRPYDDSDIIDAEILLTSMKSDGEYFIFSCCCGVPECSGWIKGISVKNDEKSIQWINGNTDENWFFDRAEIENQLMDVRTEVENYKNYFSEKGIEYVGVGYTW